MITTITVPRHCYWIWRWLWRQIKWFHAMKLSLHIYTHILSKSLIVTVHTHVHVHVSPLVSRPLAPYPLYPLVSLSPPPPCHNYSPLLMMAAAIPVAATSIAPPPPITLPLSFWCVCVRVCATKHGQMRAYYYARVMAVVIILCSLC